MTIKLKKWGNSHGVVLPHAILRTLRVSENTPLMCVIENNAIVLTPVQKKYTLESMCASINPSNKHEEIMQGRPRGKEIW